jgi:hypothetical protein
MRSSKQFAVAAVLSSLTFVAAHAAQVDFKDPKRAVGREDNIRVDAQLNDDHLSSSAPVSITYQIENLSPSTIAIADKITSADFDPETMTITITVGAEIPSGETLPHLVTIPSGEKRVLSVGAFAQVPVPSIRTPWTAVPRYVDIRVAVLRDITAFKALIEKQKTATTPLPFPNDLFERWVDSTSSVDLNSIPVQWKRDQRLVSAESSQAAAPAGGTF